MSKDKNGQELQPGDTVQFRGKVKETNDNSTILSVEGQGGNVVVVTSALEKVSESGDAEEVRNAARRGYNSAYSDSGQSPPEEKE